MSFIENMLEGEVRSSKRCCVSRYFSVLFGHFGLIDLDEYYVQTRSFLEICS